MNTSTLARQLGAALVLALTLVASASYASDHASDRPFYQWPSVTLEKDTKAVVGPVDAEQLLRVRLEPLETTAEKLNVCIFEKYCEIVDLSANKGDEGKSPELDLTPLIEKLSNDYGRPGRDGLGKTYITIQRENPEPGVDAITLSSVKAETDLTMPLPQFKVLETISRPKRGRVGSVDQDLMGAKEIDLPEKALMIDSVGPSGVRTLQ
jgi:hypothetical protein